MDILQLSAAAAVVLSPYIAVFLSSATQEIGKQVGAGAGKAAAALWERLQPKVRTTAKADALVSAAVVLDDPAMIESLLAQAIALVLTDDHPLAEAVRAILEGDKSVQTVLIDKGSTVQNITLRMRSAGNQNVTVTGANAGDISLSQ